MIIEKNDEALSQGMGPDKGRLDCCMQLKTNQLKEELEEFVDIVNWWEYKNLSNIKNSINVTNTLDKLLK